MRIKRPIFALLVLILVGGCQDRTGIDWLDPLVVRDFDKRADLTFALDLHLPLSWRRYSYCDYGCKSVCSIVPEPPIYRDLEQQNRKEMNEVRDRAEGSGLLFDVQKSGIIYEPEPIRDLSPDEVGPAKLVCLQRQQDHIKRIQSLLNSLTRSET